MNAASRTLDGASALLVLILGLSAWWVAQHGAPGPIPMHFGLDGRPDRWGDRSEAAGGLAVMAGLSALLMIFCAVLERQGDGKGWRSGLRLARSVMIVAFAFLGLMFAGLGLGWVSGGDSIGHWATALLSLLFLVLGAVMGKARPNPLFGVRTYWTLTSRLSWDKSNRLGGRLLGAIGLAGLPVAVFAPQPQGLNWLIVAVLLAAGACVLESWRVWAIDPDRRAGREPQL